MRGFCIALADTSSLCPCVPRKPSVPIAIVAMRAAHQPVVEGRRPRALAACSTSGIRAAVPHVAASLASRLLPAPPSACSFQTTRIEGLVQRRTTSRHECRPSRRERIVVATSEFWYEEEEEFDAVQGVILPKELFVLASDARDGLAALQGTKFTAGFAASKTKASAEKLWSELGQDAAPYFKKIRTRGSLDTLEDPSVADAACSSAADELWQELCTQTWRVELDYGLGSDLVPTDRLLIVCSRLAAERMLRQAGLAWPAGGGGLVAVRVQGFNTDGLAKEPLQGWRQLQPKLRQMAASPAS